MPIGAARAIRPATRTRCASTAFAQPPAAQGTVSAGEAARTCSPILATAGLASTRAAPARSAWLARAPQPVRRGRATAAVRAQPSPATRTIVALAVTRAPRRRIVSVALAILTVPLPTCCAPPTVAVPAYRSASVVLAARPASLVKCATPAPAVSHRIARSAIRS